MNELLFLLPMILFLGIVTSYQDIKTGKIRNHWLLLAIAYAVIVNLMIYVYVVSGGQDVANANRYMLELFITFLVSLIVSFVMWWVGLWTAGDAKLFAVFSLLVPLSVYNLGYVKYFASVNIIMNTVVPYFAVYAIIFLVKTSWKQKLKYMKQSLNPRQVWSMAIFIFAFLWPLDMFYKFTSLPSNFFMSIAILFVMMTVVEKTLGSRAYIFTYSLSVLRLFLDKNLLTLNSWLLFFDILIGFIILRYFILYMGYDFMTKWVDIKLFRKGMVPAEMVFKEEGEYKKQPILHFSLLSYLQEKTRKREHLFELTAEGLTEKEAKKIRSLEEKLDFEHLRVYKTMPFAPYLFLGVILTILFRGNLFIYLGGLI